MDPIKAVGMDPNLPLWDPQHTIFKDHNLVDFEFVIEGFRVDTKVPDVEYQKLKMNIALARVIAEKRFVKATRRVPYQLLESLATEYFQYGHSAERWLQHLADDYGIEPTPQSDTLFVTYIGRLFGSTTSAYSKMARFLDFWARYGLTHISDGTSWPSPHPRGKDGQEPSEMALWAKEHGGYSAIASWYSRWREAGCPEDDEFFKKLKKFPNLETFTGDDPDNAKFVIVGFNSNDQSFTWLDPSDIRADYWMLAAAGENGGWNLMEPNKYGTLQAAQEALAGIPPEDSDEEEEDETAERNVPEGWGCETWSEVRGVFEAAYVGKPCPLPEPLNDWLDGKSESDSLSKEVCASLDQLNPTYVGEFFYLANEFNKSDVGKALFAVCHDSDAIVLAYIKQTTGLDFDTMIELVEAVQRPSAEIVNLPDRAKKTASD